MEQTLIPVVFVLFVNRSEDFSFSEHTVGILRSRIFIKLQKNVVKIPLIILYLTKLYIFYRLTCFERDMGRNLEAKM
jgi:hypothetical protein